MNYPLSTVDIESLLRNESSFVGVCSYDSLPSLKDGHFCIANTDNIYPYYDMVEGGHHWVTVCCDGETVLVFDSFGRALKQMEIDYTEPNLQQYFIQAYSNETIITNTFEIQNRTTAVCGRYAILAGRLFAKDGIDGVITGFRGLFDNDTLENDRKVIALVPLQTNLIGSGYEDDLHKIYYSPKGYWRGYSAIPKLAKEAGVSKGIAGEWLKKQPIWQIYLQPPRYIPRPKFDVTTPNEVHQADLLYLPHDNVGGRTYKYALTVIDVASRYKEAQALTDKTAAQVAKALEFIYRRSPLTFPSLLQVDPGSEFKGAVQKLCDTNGTVIRRGIVGVHRDQGMVERFNRTLAERLFRHQYASEITKAGSRSTEWVLRLPDVIEALNNEVTRLTGKKPSRAIEAKTVKARHSAPPRSNRDVGFEETRLPSGVGVRYLYSPGEVEGDERHRATDPVWSLTVHTIERTAVKEGEPVLYYLAKTPSGEGPSRSFVREELQIVPRLVV